MLWYCRISIARALFAYGCNPHHTHWTRLDNTIRGVHSWRHQCSQSRSFSTRCTHSPKNAWARTYGTTYTGIVETRQYHRGTPPRASIQSSQTFFHIPLQSPRCGAPEPHTCFQRCSKRSKRTEASESLCAYSNSPPKFVPRCCPWVRHNQAKKKTHTESSPT